MLCATVSPHSLHISPDGSKKTCHPPNKVYCAVFVFFSSSSDQTDTIAAATLDSLALIPTAAYSVRFLLSTLSYFIRQGS